MMPKCRCGSSKRGSSSIARRRCSMAPSRFPIEDLAKPRRPGNIRLILNGTDLSSSLAIAGTSSNRTVNWPGPLTENTLYSGQIIASDSDGRSTTVTWTFDTVGTIRPRPNALGVNPATDIFMELVDQNRQVNTNSIVLSFNGTPVSATASKTGTRTTVSYDPPGLLPSNSTNVARLVFSDTVGTSYTNS